MTQEILPALADVGVICGRSGVRLTRLRHQIIVVLSSGMFRLLSTMSLVVKI